MNKNRPEGLSIPSGRFYFSSCKFVALTTHGDKKLTACWDFLRSFSRTQRMWTSSVLVSPNQSVSQTSFISVFARYRLPRTRHKKFQQEQIPWASTCMFCFHA